jgi:Protein of unknown function, DUF600
MSPFEKQTEILNSLLQMMHNSADANYQELSCKFAFNKTGMWCETRFSYSKNGIKISASLKEKDGISKYSLLEELHTIMKNHTGGEWDSFTLTLDADGKAHTKFHYPDVVP